jgi:hypothetical protein
MKRKLLLISILFISNYLFLQAQDDEAYYDSLLTVSVVNENPVYKPVVGLGLGVMNFYGEVHNNFLNLSLGRPAYKLNVATFLDKKQYFKTNFFLLYGELSGERRDASNPRWNLNFKSDIIDFGINIHYDFKHFIKNSPIRPFVSLGIENVQFNSKTDTAYIAPDGTRRAYYYWTDGTIRNIDESLGNTLPSRIVNRSYNYDADLRSANLYGLGNYSQSAVSIPFDIGVDFSISDRINLRFGYSIHYTFTDLIDNVSWKNKDPEIIGNKLNDMFSYTYFTLHFDLFSDDRIITYRKAFADVENFDYDLYGDEDFDMVPDFMDKCLGTPVGVLVDSISGCPLDGDGDGVPDYLDKEPGTRAGAMVDENGVEMNPDILAEQYNSEALNRKDVDIFLLMHKAQSKYARKSSVPIPPKFKKVDTDGDSYVSFDELLKSIDDFFDFSSDYTTKDINELQDFFFEQ